MYCDKLIIMLGVSDWLLVFVLLLCGLKVSDKKGLWEVICIVSCIFFVDFGKIIFCGICWYMLLLVDKFKCVEKFVLVLLLKFCFLIVFK